MISMGWQEEQRTQMRRAWLKGELTATDWLQQHYPDICPTSTCNEATQTAFAYISERQDQMNYPSYKAQAFPIGSGQIEGFNKSVIGYRMKQSGMQWSRSGAARMASLRAWRCSKQQLVSHDTIRLAAFPCPLA